MIPCCKCYILESSWLAAAAAALYALFSSSSSSSLSVTATQGRLHSVVVACGSRRCFLGVAVQESKKKQNLCVHTHTQRERDEMNQGKVGHVVAFANVMGIKCAELVVWRVSKTVGYFCA